MTTNLTEKQRKFVEAYMGKASGNATEAARLAGYSGDDNTLGAVGSENLRKPKIQQAITERVAEDPLVMDREDLQQFWTRVVLGSEPNQDEPISMKDRLKASEMLAKSQAVFKDVVQHEVGEDSAKEIAALLGVQFGDG